MKHKEIPEFSAACKDKSSKQDEEYTAEKERHIHKKIIEKGYQITLDRFAGPSVEYLTIVIAENTSLNIVRSKETKRINSITFLQASMKKRYSISYLPSEQQEFIGYVEAHDAPDQNYCVLAKAEGRDFMRHRSLRFAADRMGKVRNHILNELNITLQELYLWSVWFFEDKEEHPR